MNKKHYHNNPPLREGFESPELRFSELESFRFSLKQNRNHLSHYPYTSNKNRVLLYKVVFLLLTIIFTALSAYLYTANICWVFHSFIANPDMLKNFLSLICSVCAICSFIIGFFASPEIDIATHLVHKAKKRAKKIFKRAACEIRFNHRTDDSLIDYCRELYHGVYEKMTRFKDEQLLLLKRIRISRQLSDKEKETLYNQAITELESKLQGLLEDYKSGTFTLRDI